MPAESESPPPGPSGPPLAAVPPAPVAPVAPIAPHEPAPPSPQGTTPAWLLPVLMVSGAVLGLAIGAYFAPRWTQPEFASVRGFFKLLGDILMNTLKALVVPLIVFSVIGAVSRLGALQRARRLFTVTLAYFLITMSGAIALGLVLVNVIQPGRGASHELRTEQEKQRAEAAKQRQAEGVSPALKLYDVVRDMFPANLAKAAAENQVLGLIVFSIVAGILLGRMGAQAAPILKLCDAFNELFLRFIFVVIWFAPLGIVGIVAENIGRLGGAGAISGELQRLGWYAFTVVLGLLIHGLVVLPLILALLARRNPLRYALNMSEALICAFSTASSGATIPLTVRGLTEKNGVSRDVVGVVVPLGATVNMNGTALYEAVAVMFIAQSYGIGLDFSGQLIVALTSLLAAIGAAAIPEAGLVTMVLVLVAAGLPVEGAALVISIDWLLDRCRTTVNVWDDCVGCAVAERFGGTAATAPDAPAPGA